MTETTSKTIESAMSSSASQLPEAPEGMEWVKVCPTTDDDSELRAGAYTPESEYYGSVWYPDISMYCRGCQRHVDCRELPHHRAYHDALVILGYNVGAKPISMQALLKRRRKVLNELMLEAFEQKALLDPKMVQSVNEAYEFLKSDLDEKIDISRRCEDQPERLCQGTSHDNPSSSILAIGVCSEQNSRWKNHMEDAYCVHNNFGRLESRTFVGVFDGHQGRWAAEVAALELRQFLLQEMSRFDKRIQLDQWEHFISDAEMDCLSEVGSRPSSAKSETEQLRFISADLVHQVVKHCRSNLQKLEENDFENSPHENRAYKNAKKVPPPTTLRMRKAMERAHKFTDVLLSWGRNERSRVRWSGTTTAAILVEDHAGDVIVNENEEADSTQPVANLYVANCGDTRALLIRGNRPYRLTRDHTPSDARERERLQRLGFRASESEKEARVNGVLRSTRSLGNHGDEALRRVVLTKPAFKAVELDAEAQLVVVATHGVWQVLSDEEVASVLTQVLPDNYIPAPSRLGTGVEELLKSRSKRPSKQLSAPSEARILLQDEFQESVNHSPAHSNADDVTSVTSAVEEVDTDTENADRTQRDVMTSPAESELLRRDVARAMAERLAQVATMAGATDNITVVVLLLPGSKL